MAAREPHDQKRSAIRAQTPNSKLQASIFKLMNAGFSSLTALKKAVLPAPMRAQTTWNDQLVAIGLGVAAQFGKATNRLLSRAVGATYVRDGECTAIILDRYPLETLTSLTIRRSQTTTEEDITYYISNQFEKSGIIELQGFNGTHRDKITVTFTGGYWWDESEDASGTLPVGATLIPGDLVHAWHVQVQAVLEATGILKASSVSSADQKPVNLLPDLKLVLQVKQILNPFTRFA